MCGICGSVTLGSSAELLAASKLKKMTDVIYHRGPDDHGFYRDSDVALGMRRLSVIDLATGDQPIHNEDKTVWVVQNGEIYNFKELTSDLIGQGHQFYTQTDTEVLVHLYEQYGEDFVLHTRGMFGVALWDRRRRTFILTRDRLGIKPLYYTVVGGQLIFGSEIKAILKSGLIRPEVDPVALDTFLTLGYVPAPRTMFKNIQKLKPAHQLICHNGTITHRKYWSLPEEIREEKHRSESDYEEALMELLSESIELETVSDVPLGVMLSGGIDSSAITGILANQTSAPVKTFSVGFEEDDQNELADAAMIARRFGTDHHELSIPFREHSRIFEDLVWHLDEPIADLSAIGFYFISKLAREHVTVALSGQGADELLGGYRKYVTGKMAAYYQLLPKSLRENLLTPLSNMSYSPALFKKAARSLNESDPGKRFMVNSSVWGAEMKADIYSGHFQSWLAADENNYLEPLLESYRAEIANRDSLSGLLYMDTKLGLTDDLLAYFDKISMANSLEVRVPFLDHKLVEFCFSVPSKYKVRRLTTKHILKKATNGLLPDEILKKKKVGFFAHMIDRWIREERDYVQDVLFDSQARSRSYFDEEQVRKLVESHLSGEGNWGRQIFCLFLLELWHRTFIDKNREDNLVGKQVSIGR